MLIRERNKTQEPWSTDDLPRPGQVSSETPYSAENCRLRSSRLRHSEIMLKFKVSEELGIKFALTWISLRAEYLFLSCSSRVADQDPLVFLFYLTLKAPAVILCTVTGMKHMKF